MEHLLNIKVDFVPIHKLSEKLNNKSEIDIFVIVSE